MAARFSLDVLARQYAVLTTEIGVIERCIHALHRSCEESQRLQEIPGVGPIVATALIAEVGDWKAFSSGRSLAAWIGLVPRQNSTGGKTTLLGISKRGNTYLRRILIHGARSCVQTCDRQRHPLGASVTKLEQRMYRNKVIIALAHKMAWIVWKINCREMECSVRNYLS